MAQRPWKIRARRLPPINQPYAQPGRPQGRVLSAQTRGEPEFMPNRQDVVRETQRWGRRLRDS